jgi:hypothetical protein
VACTGGELGGANAAGDVTGWTLDHFAKLTRNDRAVVSSWNSAVFAAGTVQTRPDHIWLVFLNV